MGIPLSKFKAAQAAAEADMAARLLQILTDANEALSARELAATFVGATGRYAPVLSPRVAEVLPLVEPCLERLVTEGRLECAPVEEGVRGRVMHYARKGAL